MEIVDLGCDPCHGSARKNRDVRHTHAHQKRPGSGRSGGYVAYQRITLSTFSQVTSCDEALNGALSLQIEQVPPGSPLFSFLL